MASFGYGWYDFSLRNFFQGLDISMFIWGIIFLIFFFVVNKVMTKKFLKNQKFAGSMIALIISALTVFYMSKKIDIVPIIYSFGIDASFLKTLLYILAGIFVIFIMYKWGVSMIFILLGLILLISGIFGWAYQGFLAIVLGVVLLLIGLTIKKKIKGKHYRAVGRGIGKISKGAGKVGKGVGRGIGKISKTSIPKPPKEPRTPPKEPSKKDSGPTKQDKINLARRLGIKKLTEEYQKILKEYNEGLVKAETYHKEASRLGWTKTKQGKKAYKAWYRQYHRNIELQKEAKKLYDRIEHLRKKLV